MPDEQDIATDRATAHALGTRFYHGTVCKRGHDGVRYTSKNKCYQCMMIQSANRAPADDKERARKRAWKLAHPETVKAERKRLYPAALARERARRERKREMVRPQREATASLDSLARRLADLERALSHMTPKVRTTTRHYVRLRVGKSLARIARDERKANDYASYRASNRVKRRMRQAREKANGGSCSIEQRHAILASQDYACLYCGDTEQLELDHKNPVKLGGSNHCYNLQYLCRDCNNRKRDTPDIAYRQLIGLPPPEITL